MELVKLFFEMLEEYPRQYERNNKASNPYFNVLKGRIRQSLKPLSDEYGFIASGPGGQGLMRRNPYIALPIRPNYVNHGIYPILQFQIPDLSVVLKIGDADDNEPRQELVKKLAQRSKELLPGFVDSTEDGYPAKRYSKSDLQDEAIEKDLRNILSAYKEILEEFSDDVELYLETDNTGSKSGGKKSEAAHSMSDSQIQFLIDAFLLWYANDPHREKENVEEYAKLTRPFIENLSNEALLDFVFRFARDGGYIQSGGARTAGSLRSAAAENLTKFRMLLLQAFDEKLNLDQWWEEADKYKGFGKGIRTIFLHRVQPSKFSVFNNKSQEAYKLLGLLPKELPPAEAGQYSLVVQAAQKLVAFRPGEMNLYKADAMTHFLLGTDDGQIAFKKIPADNIGGTVSPTELNTILYGPPGTGKTYCTINRALEIVHGDSSYCREKDRAILVEEFRKLMESGQIEFITFHQSYSYEEFVEGIRPILNSQQGIGYELRSGVFKRIVDRAKLENTSPDAQYIFDENKINFFKMSLGDANDPDEGDIFRFCIENGCISLGWGGNTDYSRASAREEIASLYNPQKDPSKSPYGIQAIDIFKNWMKKDDLVLVSFGNFKVRSIGRIVGDYEFNGKSPTDHHHFRKVEWLMKEADIPVESISKKQLSQQTIYQFYKTNLKLETLRALLSKRKQKGQDKRFVLVIDEINRGNISRIFGELITLIEEDKRLGSPNELRVRLPYSSEEFVVPLNLYLIGTMNTADRSIALIDVALRRRFSFVPMDPDLSLVKNDKLRTILSKINENIIAELGPDYAIGHSYFMDRSENDLRDIMNKKVLPLLSEYFYNDNEKICDIFKGTSVEENIAPVGTDGAKTGRARLAYVDH